MKFKNKATALEIGIERLLLKCEFQTNPIHRPLRIGSNQRLSKREMSKNEEVTKKLWCKIARRDSSPLRFYYNLKIELFRNDISILFMN